MAKLKARGRKEIFRLRREEATPDDPDLERKVNFKALMSDGMILKRFVIYYKPGKTGYGDKRHDYGWTELGRIKPGLSAEDMLKKNLDKGWILEDASPEYFVLHGNVIEQRSQGPVISEAQAAKRQAAREKSHERRQAQERIKNGPGFYVTNAYKGMFYRQQQRIADHPYPIDTLDAAVTLATQRLKYFLDLKFDYLLPVLVIEAKSRRDAEEGLLGIGKIYWRDGYFLDDQGEPIKQAPQPETTSEQLSLFD